MVLCTIHAFESLNLLNDQVLPTFEYKSENVEKKEKPKFEAFSVITTRNLFGVAIEKESSADKNAEAPVAKIKIRLVGTSVTTGTTPFAILENDKGDQDVFDLNGMAFDQAKIVEINEDSIKVEYGGRTDTLFIEETEGGGGGTSEGIQTTDNEGTSFSVPETELNDALANLPRLLSQARAVPYFRNGQSIGMRLFAIRSGSLYEKLGLKNGDILMAVNSNSLSDPTQALKIFEQLKSERSIQLKVERSGEEKQLQYSIN